jgi:hypothetical protein
MNFLEPWYALSEEECQELSTELTRELPTGHVLKGISVRCLARRQDRDDVLVELADGSGRLACVHLTWQVEQEPLWPNAVIYENTAKWLTVMHVHHLELDA